MLVEPNFLELSCKQVVIRIFYLFKKLLKSMSKTCFLCRVDFDASSLKTPRSRFKMMGLQAPEGMGETDRVCSKCVNEIHNEELRRIKISHIKKEMRSA